MVILLLLFAILPFFRSQDLLFDSSNSHGYRKNWEDPEYASKGKKGPPEEKLLQGVIILFMIATQAPEFRLFWQFNFL